MKKKYDPNLAVVQPTKTYTYYLNGGRRVVASGVGTCIEVAKQHKIAGESIQGVRDGDDHSRRWNAADRYWEYMYIDYV